MADSLWHMVGTIRSKPYAISQLKVFFSSLLCRQEQRGITRRPHASMIAS